VRKLRDVVNQRVRTTSAHPRPACARQAKMPRKDFLKLFPGNEDQREWVDELLASAREWSGLRDVREKSSPSRKLTIDRER
jgi:RNA polymerase primary sigma factor